MVRCFSFPSSNPIYKTACVIQCHLKKKKSIDSPFSIDMCARGVARAQTNVVTTFTPLFLHCESYRLTKY